MKINIIRAILIIALIGTFATIFGFSNQNAKESSGLSKKVTEEVVKHISKIKPIEEAKKENIMNQMQKIIRKIAHYTIYTIVGILLMSLMSTYNLEENTKIYISTVIGVLYASADEIHQAFIPGRGPQVTDIMLDTIGVLTGIIFVMLIIEICRKIGKNNCQKNVKNC